MERIHPAEEGEAATEDVEAAVAVEQPLAALLLDAAAEAEIAQLFRRGRLRRRGFVHA